MTVASIVGALSLQVPFLMIPLLFDLEATGQYFMAYRMLVLPASLLAAAVSQVFFGEAAYRRDRPEAMRYLAKRSASVLFIFSIPTYAVAFVAGPLLFVSVLGEEWQEAGEIARIVSPWLLVWSVASPLSTLLLVGRRERESLFFTTAEFLARSVAIALGAALGSLIGAIVALSAVSFVISVVALWRILPVASVRLRDLGRPIATTVAMTIPSVVVLALVMSLLPAQVSGVTTVAIAAVAWLGAVALSTWRSAELRALLHDADD
jgi:O-antigen/teichoic acid export membrane protein